MILVLQLGLMDLLLLFFPLSLSDNFQHCIVQSCNALYDTFNCYIVLHNVIYCFVLYHNVLYYKGAILYLSDHLRQLYVRVSVCPPCVRP